MASLLRDPLGVLDFKRFAVWNSLSLRASDIVAAELDPRLWPKRNLANLPSIHGFCLEGCDSVGARDQFSVSLPILGFFSGIVAMARELAIRGWLILEPPFLGEGGTGAG